MCILCVGFSFLVGFFFVLGLLLTTGIWLVLGKDKKIIEGLASSEIFNFFLIGIITAKIKNFADFINKPELRLSTDLKH